MSFKRLARFSERVEECLDGPPCLAPALPDQPPGVVDDQRSVAVIAVGISSIRICLKPASRPPCCRPPLPSARRPGGPSPGGDAKARASPAPSSGRSPSWAVNSPGAAVVELMWISDWPVRIRLASPIARSVQANQTPTARPYSVELAMRTASSSSSYGMPGDSCSNPDRLLRSHRPR